MVEPLAVGGDERGADFYDDAFGVVDEGHCRHKGRAGVQFTGLLAVGRVGSGFCLAIRDNLQRSA